MFRAHLSAVSPRFDLISALNASCQRDAVKFIHFVRTGKASSAFQFSLNVHPAGCPFVHFAWIEEPTHSQKLTRESSINQRIARAPGDR